MEQNEVILFDGVCNFCNSTINFVIKRDKKAKLRFASLQSEKGQQLLLQYHLPTNTMDSFIFIKNGKAYTKSTAALQVCRYLNGLWPLCYGFIIVPKFIRNSIYNWVAKNRYTWFGKKNQCMIPTADVRSRFL